ncbi:ABC-2 transporter permease [Paenibacillus sp. S150]|uniref:ABC-2 transporter permease n=1 Tax=Paenibacillus sp. S150 TaxID=2749826 RepID=UPI001C56E0D4|nr:ABC-2 transporter permease [Paenibacillus sp. S150]MBW4080568.1 ABC-2 transporter permease [Paenibacillus sp. S150]
MYSSFYLIRKDFILVRKFLLLMNACTLDVQHNNQRLLVTLPLPRHQLVLAKYLSLFPYVIISLICTLLLYLTGQSAEPIAWRELSLVIAGFPIIAGLYLPLYFWLGQKGMQVVNMLFMMLIMFGFTAMSSLAKQFPVLFEWVHSGTADNILLLAIACVAYLFLLYCSYLISLRIFTRKDI